MLVRRRILSITSVLLLIILIFAGIRLAAVASGSNDGLLVRIGNQQVVTLDLRDSVPISSTILGVNIFPRSGTSSDDNASGFMDYSSLLTADLVDAHIKLLRFPGSKWGEEHTLSLDQLSAFSALLQEVNADGMVQVRLSGPPDIASRTATAGRWVDFLNNSRSSQRTGKYAHAPYHAVKYWTVGDEPDTLIDPATGKKYLVRDYVNDFIQFSTVMHRMDPTIKVFGPDISEFYGPGTGPRDADGQLWMEGFLKGVGAYEQAHHVVLLDGVSFHRYQLTAVTQASYLFLSSTSEWNYLLPALHQLINQDLKREVPVAVTEINTGTDSVESQPSPVQGFAALWWADTLATLMNQQVQYVAFASATSIGAPSSAPLSSGESQTGLQLFTSDGHKGQQPTPMFRVMELFAHLQNNLIPLEVQHDPVSVYATQDGDHQVVSLLFINKLSTSQLAQISGESNLMGISPWNNLDISLMGDSIVVVTLHRNSNAEAYSFAVPGGDAASTAPIIHTLCGNKTGGLDNSVPC